MDTIIYIYRWNKPERDRQLHEGEAKLCAADGGLCKEDLYCREDYDLQDYHLIRIAMSERLLQICAEKAASMNVRRARETGSFLERKRRRGKREREQLFLTAFLQDIHWDAEGVSYVCEEPVAYFAGREFNGYFQTRYVRHLLQYAGLGNNPLQESMSQVGARRRYSGECCSHFIILGQTACVQELVYELVDSMKSLKWILPRRLYRQQQQELVDILYEEYGLAVEVKLLEETDSFTKVYPSCRLPSVILDFSETDRVPAMDVARDSVWLDMGSSEEKRRRIEERNTGIHYVSLKKEWKQPQKALNYLDTTSKNGYNT